MSQWRRRLRRRQNNSRNSCPFRKYYPDPVAFCREVLGYIPNEFQAEIIRIIAGYPAMDVGKRIRIERKRAKAIGFSSRPISGIKADFVIVDEASSYTGVPDGKVLE